MIEENYEYEEPRGDNSYYDCDEYDLDEDTEIMNERLAGLEESIVQAKKKQKIIPEPPKYHYVYITNLGKLVGAQASKHKTKKEICDRCLHYFSSVKDLKNHEEDCSNLNKCKVKLPNPDKKIKFKNFSNQELMPFVIYADFESLLKKPPADNENSNVVQLHEALSVGYYAKCSYDDDLSGYKSYNGPDPAKWFVQELADFSNFAELTFKNKKPMLPLTPEEQEAYDNATTCHICGVMGFIEKDKKRGKAQDHSHLTGKYRYLFIIIFFFLFLLIIDYFMKGGQPISNVI